VTSRGCVRIGSYDWNRTDVRCRIIVTMVYMFWLLGAWLENFNEWMGGLFVVLINTRTWLYVHYQSLRLRPGIC
jgi:hypothetical protein